MKIGIIIGSTRRGRVGASIGQWVAEVAGQRSDAEFEVLDLAAFDLPLFDAPMPPMALQRNYDSEAVSRWSAAVDACDAFVFVTPEYNHSVPGGMKNAVDHLGPEWLHKGVTFVGYAYEGGVRAIEHWRLILANFHMHATRAHVGLSLITDMGENGFAPAERRAAEVNNALDELIALTNATKVLRPQA